MEILFWMEISLKSPKMGLHAKPGHRYIILYALSLLRELTLWFYFLPKLIAGSKMIIVRDYATISVYR